MALIRNTAAMTYKGRVGNTTFYVEGGRQLARVAQNSSNYGDTARRSEAQQNRRVMWANLVNFYKTSKGWMSKAYETKKRTQSDYNKFMSLNLPGARISLTKNEAAQGACIVDTFKISEGSIRPINVVKYGDLWRTDISIGSYEINDETTVAEFSNAVINANNYVHEGMQLTFVSYQQGVSTTGIPNVVCTAYEVTLNKTDSRLLRAFMPEFAIAGSDSFIETSSDISVGCFAFIWSETVDGGIRVSSQTLISNNEDLISRYSTNAQLKLAVDSYGVDQDVFLATGSSPILPTPQPNYIQSAEINGEQVESGSSIQVDEDAVLQDFRFSFANEALTTSVKLKGTNGNIAVLNTTHFTQNGFVVVLTNDGLAAVETALGVHVFPTYIEAVIDGGVYSLGWNVSQPLG